jgi:hypothetical protein
VLTKLFFGANLVMLLFHTHSSKVLNATNWSR